MFILIRFVLLLILTIQLIILLIEYRSWLALGFFLWCLIILVTVYWVPYECLWHFHLCIKFSFLWTNVDNDHHLKAENNSEIWKNINIHQLCEVFFELHQFIFLRWSPDGVWSISGIRIFAVQICSIRYDFASPILTQRSLSNRRELLEVDRFYLHHSMMFRRTIS